MREILFRGKRLDNGEWERGWYCKVGHIGTEKDYIIPDYASAFYGIEVDPVTVGQYTGANAEKSYRGDRPEDRRVFEGDTVKTKKYGRDNGKGRNWNEYDLFTVKWHEGGFVIENETRRFRLIDDPRIYEIIRTIHDNPELIGGAQ